MCTFTHYIHTVTWVPERWKLIFSADIGCIVLPEFHREFRLPDTNTTEYNFITANIISCMQGGTFFGSILALPLTEKYGRVPIMGLAGVVFTAGSAMQVWFHKLHLQSFDTKWREI